MNNDTELVEFYKFLSERAIIDDCCRGEGEAECAVKLYNKSKVKNLDIQRVSGCCSYEIDSDGHCKAGVDITDNEPKVIGAMNGRGDSIDVSRIKIDKLNNR